MENTRDDDFTAIETSLLSLVQVALRLSDFFTVKLSGGDHVEAPYRLIPDSLRVALGYRCGEGYGLHGSICGKSDAH